MSNAPDIERMFAYIGVTDGRYREFASGDDPAEALSTWALVDSSDAEATGRDPALRDGTATAPVQRADVFQERLAARRPAPPVAAAAPPPLTARPAPMPRPPGSRPPTGVPGTVSTSPPPFRPPSVPPGSRPPSLAQRAPLDPTRRAPPIGRPPSLAPQPRPPAAGPREEDRTAFLTAQATVRPAVPEADPYKTAVAPTMPVRPQAQAPYPAARPAAPAAAAAPERTLFSRPAPEPVADEPAAEPPAAAQGGGLNRMFARLGTAPKKDEEPVASGTPLSRIFRRLS